MLDWRTLSFLDVIPSTFTQITLISKFSKFHEHRHASSCGSIIFKITLKFLVNDWLWTNYLKFQTKLLNSLFYVEKIPNEANAIQNRDLNFNPKNNFHFDSSYHDSFSFNIRFQIKRLKTIFTCISLICVPSLFILFRPISCWFHGTDKNPKQHYDRC